MQPHGTPIAVTGAPRTWLRLEGLAVLLLTMLLYRQGGHSWLLFAACFLLPDVSFAGYLGGPRLGALAYNVAHSYVGPVTTAVVTLLAERSPVAALIWTAHVGFDRAVGYGLTYPSGFADTHLGRLSGERRGPAAPPA